MIKKDIERKHIIQAIKHINANEIPGHRKSINYDLIYDNKPYPPKYVLSLANKFANGNEISYNAHHAVHETHVTLKKLGFDINEKSSSSMKNKSNIILIKCKNQIIFFGPPGTGKTYNARELAVDLIGEEKSNA